MAFGYKVIAWIWSAILVMLALGAISDQLFIVALFMLVGLAAIVPIASVREKREAIGLTGKRPMWTSIAFVFVGLIILGATAPETPEMKAERIKREATSKADAEALAVREQQAADAEKKKEADAAAAEQRKKEEEMASGLHCLSSWDGSSRSFAEQVGGRLRDPDSFKHYETRIGKIDKNGEHVVIMEYGARNGFGGMNRQVAMGIVDGATCNARVTSLGDE